MVIPSCHLFQDNTSQPRVGRINFWGGISEIPWVSIFLLILHLRQYFCITIAPWTRWTSVPVGSRHPTHCSSYRTSTIHSRIHWIRRIWLPRQARSFARYSRCPSRISFLRTGGGAWRARGEQGMPYLALSSSPVMIRRIGKTRSWKWWGLIITVLVDQKTTGSP